MRNKIYAIVEGHGEANRSLNGGQPAVHVLIQRLLYEVNQCHGRLFTPSDSPWRLKGVGQFSGEKLANVIRAHKEYDDCAGLLILCDGDDGCPVERANEIKAQILEMEMLPFSIAIVIAQKEFEGWFLASLSSIHEGKVYEGDSEEKRDAKGWLKTEFSYRPTRDQSDYTRRIDIVLAQQNSRSFRRMCHAIDELVS